MAERNQFDIHRQRTIRATELLISSPGQGAFGPDNQNQIAGFVGVDGTIIGCGMLGITPIGSFALCGREKV